MKTENLSSEKNGISIAVTTPGQKAFYATPSQLRAVLANGAALLAQLDSVPAEELAAIDQRAAMDPDSRKAGRVSAQRAALEQAVESATSEEARTVAQLTLQLFNAKNK